jgi:hypothetical protein
MQWFPEKLAAVATYDQYVLFKDKKLIALPQL